MKKFTVSQVSEITGVSIRTLRYYDQIGLLRPAETTAAGYRLYGDDEMKSLQNILFYKELDFDLKEIGKIIKDPNFDAKKALQMQRNLLVMKEKRLTGLIELIEKTIEGSDTMSFKEFDMKKIEAAREEHKKETEERWGQTEAYKQSIKKTNDYNEEDWKRITDEAERIYNAFIKNMDGPADNSEAMALAAKWQDHITRNYYDCSDEMLAGLAEMYVSDPRFKSSIDQRKDGLAEFMRGAITAYCKDKQ